MPLIEVEPFLVFRPNEDMYNLAEGNQLFGILQSFFADIQLVDGNGDPGFPGAWDPVQVEAEDGRFLTSSMSDVLSPLVEGYNEDRARWSAGLGLPPQEITLGRIDQHLDIYYYKPPGGGMAWCRFELVLFETNQDGVTKHWRLEHGPTGFLADARLSLKHPPIEP